MRMIDYLKQLRNSGLEGDGRVSAAGIFDVTCGGCARRREWLKNVKDSAIRDFSDLFIDEEVIIDKEDILDDYKVK